MWNNLLIAKLIEFSTIDDQINIIKAWQAKPIVNIVKNNILNYALDLKAKSHKGYLDFDNLNERLIDSILDHLRDRYVGFNFNNGRNACTEEEFSLRHFIMDCVSKKHLYITRKDSTLFVQYKIDFFRFKEYFIDIWDELVTCSEDTYAYIYLHNLQRSKSTATLMDIVTYRFLENPPRLFPDDYGEAEEFEHYDLNADLDAEIKEGDQLSEESIEEDGDEQAKILLREGNEYRQRVQLTDEYILRNSIIGGIIKKET